MINKQLVYPGFTIDVPCSWDDITATLDDADAPITIADPQAGLGAFQISPALYKRGALPTMTPNDLRNMLLEFTSARGFHAAGDVIENLGDTNVVGGVFRSSNYAVEVAYVSDGRSVLLVTYVCEWFQMRQESGVRMAVIRSIRFVES